MAVALRLRRGRRRRSCGCRSAPGTTCRCCSRRSASSRSIAIVCVNRSLALAPASVVVPYQYTLIVWAVIFGYVVFSDVPRLQMLVGAAIIVGAGPLHLLPRTAGRASPLGSRKLHAGAGERYSPRSAMSSRWIISARPAKPRIVSISRLLRPAIRWRVVGVVGDEAAADLLAGLAADVDGIAALEVALDAAHAGGQQALAGAQRLDRAGVDDQRAARLQPARDPALARGRPGWRRRGTRCTARRRRCATADALSWPLAITMVVPPAVAILPASILVCMPPRDSSEPAAPAIASIAGRDALDRLDQRRVRVDRPAARCRGRRRRRAARAGRRPSWWRRGRRGGRCRRSGSRWWRRCRSR